MLKLSHSGTIRAWRTDKGHDVFFPQIINQEKKIRGGAFVAAPVFGEVPHTQAWEGVSLPRHGNVRFLSPVEPVWCENMRNSFTYTIPFSRPTQDFPWQYIVRIMIDESQKDKLQLIHQVEVTRQISCRNPRPMPLSFGFHPYFATHGRTNTVVKYGREPKVTLTGNLSSSQQFPLDGLRTSFAVAGGVISMCTTGYDEMKVWTDNPEQYLCVEPTLGRRTELLLAPGESRVGSCRILYSIAPYC